jgi:serine/threonine protein kinase
VNLLPPILTDLILQDRYQIQSQLSKKAGRRTLLALDLHTHRSVIIKLLIFNAEFAWDDLKLFKREIETLKSIEHPAIPRYLDSFDVDIPNCQGFALVQSYIEAPSLAQAYQDGRRFTDVNIRQLAHALLDILIYLHEYTPSIIHRDIKPSNILIANRTSHNIGDIYLVDFGAVQGNLDQDGSTITIVGTYGYMPPEQFGGRTNPASDLYSLGATLIYLITGIHPADLSTKDCKIQFDCSTDLDSNDLDLKAWLDLMVEPSLERRFASASIAKAELDRVRSKIQLIPDLNIKLEAKKPKFLSLNLSDIFDSKIFIFFGIMMPCITCLNYILSMFLASVVISSSFYIFIIVASGFGQLFMYALVFCYFCAGTISYYPIALLLNMLIWFIYNIYKISKIILRFSN